MATILLTGASGFIGSWLTPLLSRQGHALLLLLRQPQQLDALRRQCAARGGDPQRLQALAGDLSQPGLGLDPGSLGNIDLIYHLGARFAWGLSAQQAAQTNVAGSLAVVELAARLQARLILIGGFMLENPVHQHAIGIDLQRPLASPWPAIYPRVGAYEASKLEGHYRALALAAERGVRVNAVHPATLCGHSHDGSLAVGQPLHTLIGNLAAGRLSVIPGSPRHWLPLISVDHLCALLAALVEHPLADGSSLLALDEQSPDLAEMLALLGAGLQRRAPRHHLPLPLLRGLLRLPLAERLLHTRRESLSFIRTERYSTHATRAYCARVGVDWPDIRVALRRSAEHWHAGG